MCQNDPTTLIKREHRTKCCTAKIISMHKFAHVRNFDEADKRRYRDEHFPIDLQKAYDLGKRLVEEK